MACHGGPDIVEDNLIFCVDAGNTKSYPGSGTTWTDISSYGKAGTMDASGPTWTNVSNSAGDYMDFSGSNNQKVLFANIAADDPLQLLSNNSGDGLTIAFALKENAYDPLGRIIDKSDGATAANGWGMWWETENALGFKMSMGDVSDPVLTGNISSIKTNWNIYHHTHTFSTNGYVWYVNDSVNSSGTKDWGTFTTGVVTGMAIGNWPHSTGRELDGRIGFVMVYDRPLSAAEVKQNYNATKRRYGL